MRENRTSGSEGRESETNRTSLPLLPSSVIDNNLTSDSYSSTHGKASCRGATQPASGRATLLCVVSITFVGIDFLCTQVKRLD